MYIFMLHSQQLNTAPYPDPPQSIPSFYIPLSSMCNISYQLKQPEHFRISNQSFLCISYHSLLHSAYFNHSSFFSWSSCIFVLQSLFALTSDILLPLLLPLLPAFVRISFATEAADILHRECNFAYTDKIEYPSRLGRRCNGRQASKLLYAWREWGRSKSRRRRRRRRKCFLRRL